MHSRRTKKRTDRGSKLREAVTENNNKVAQAVSEGIKSIEKSNVTSNTLLLEVKTIKECMLVL